MTTEDLAASPGSEPIGPGPDTPPESPRRPARLLGRLGPEGPAPVAGLAEALGKILGGPLEADRFSLLDRAAALGRPMVVVHLDWPRFRTRLALGVDPPLAHALADRLLGFERDLAEVHLQVTPVEWGLLGFLAARGLDWLEAQPGPLGPWDLVIDRVGPGPFDGTGLGPIVTLRWRVRVGNTTGSARLWLPWALLAPWLEGTTGDPAPAMPGGPPRQAPVPGPTEPTADLGDLADLAVEWRIIAGTATLPGEPDCPPLRVGKLLLIDGAPLGGDPALPTGPVTLAPGAAGCPGGPSLRASLAPAPNGRSGRLTLLAAPHSGPPAPPERAPGEVAFAIEIGSVCLRLGQVAGLRPGDALDVGPDSIGLGWVRLGERRVAVGELVRVDTELGVRIVAVESRRAITSPPTET